MRSEAEMLHLIIDTAREDDQIRAVIMNGSRANPRAPRDPFQDYDIVYLVKEVAPFWKNLAWIKRFGELMILQMPEDMQDPPPANDGSFIYLMLFMDGNRIDLSIYPVSGLEDMGRDSQRIVCPIFCKSSRFEIEQTGFYRKSEAISSQSILLLDKDNRIEPFPPPSDADYLPKPPDAKQFQDCCNEFWWVSANIFKGLWRNEVTYAHHDLRSSASSSSRWSSGMQGSRPTSKSVQANRESI